MDSKIIELVDKKIESLLERVHNLTEDDISKEEQLYQLLSKYIALKNQLAR